MTDGQLYLGGALSLVVALVGILVNVGYFVTLISRMSRLEYKIDLLTGKVADVDSRLVRIDDKLGIQPR